MENTQKTPEPIELRPEDLVSGEVYKNVCDKYFYIFQHKNTSHLINYTKMINHDGTRFNNHIMLISGEYYHATPQEKALLLSEEPTDWEAKYNELKSNYELAKNEIEIEKDLREQWHNHYFKLKEEYNELKSKYDQLEPKGEKVYFYFDYLDNLIKTTDFEFALHESSEDSPIYKGIFMGKKKSVLVNENS